ncbi:MAG: hypothetical protein ACFB15_29790 [Cyclobacteriaceae bacterium]
MDRRSITVLCAIIAAISLHCCDYHGHYRQVPFSVQQHLAELPAWQAPRKIEVDHERKRVYWLNRNGEIWAIDSDGSKKTLINKGIGAELGITYIEDFTIDYQNGTLYFTDLMDVTTGLSALKSSDLQGNNISTITSFPNETLYAIKWNIDQQQLYYATRGGNEHYQVHRLDESTPLVVSDHKISLNNIPLENYGTQNTRSYLVSDQSTGHFKTHKSY